MSFVAKEAYDDLQCRYIQVADMLKRIVADYRRSDEDARGVSAMESLIEEAERLVDGDTARMRDIKQAAVDACQSVQNEIEAGATFANIPLAIASRMALAWLDIERRQGEVEIRADRAQALFRQIRRWIESGEDCTNRIYESVGKELDY